MLYVYFTSSWHFELSYLGVQYTLLQLTLRLSYQISLKSPFCSFTAVIMSVWWWEVQVVSCGYSSGEITAVKVNRACPEAV